MYSWISSKLGIDRLFESENGRRVWKRRVSVTISWENGAMERALGGYFFSASAFSVGIVRGGRAEVVMLGWQIDSSNSESQWLG